MSVIEIEQVLKHQVVDFSTFTKAKRWAALIVGPHLVQHGRVHDQEAADADEDGALQFLHAIGDVCRDRAMLP